MSCRKEYRKTWMANRRKIQRLKKAQVRAVVSSDSDSDADSLASGTDVPDNSSEALNTAGVDPSGITSQVLDDVHSVIDSQWDSIDLECTQDLCSDSDDTDIDKEANLTEDLQTWVTESGVKRTQVDKLLRILKPIHQELPLTAETLMKTKRTVQCSSVSGGDYIYLGFCDTLRELVAGDTTVTELELAFNIDGVPLFSSSKYSLWPVLCYVLNLKPRKVFVVSIYGGYSKPCDLQFLQESVNELKALVQNGLVVDGRKILCIPKMCVCDAVARAMVKRMKQFSGYYGCDKCSQRGLFVGRMTYPDVNSPLRSDSSFRALTNKEHHTGSSPFLELPIDMIAFFPIDYMHQVCLGVTKRLLVCWSSGGKKVRLSYSQRSQIDTRLIAFRSAVTSEFNRKPRSLSELAHWKATEFRTFLLYAGYFCLNGIIDDEILNHFMCLSVGVAVLVSETMCKNQSLKQFAHELLLYFVNRSRELYGPEFLVYNVHSLVHLSLEVDQFGALDNSSAFIFENFLQVLKRCVRSARNPVLQAANRLQEQTVFSKYSYKHFVLNSVLEQYSVTPPNNVCILEDGRCCQVVSVNKQVVTCMVFGDVQPLYTSPCDSRILGVFRANLSSGVLKHLPHGTNARKAMSCVDFAQSKILFIQLLHTM